MPYSLAGRQLLTGARISGRLRRLRALLREDAAGRWHAPSSTASRSHPGLLRTAVDEIPDGQAMAGISALRTILATPLMRENEVIGAMQSVVPRCEPYTDKQIALVQTFADQAVIAIENARLFEEVQARTRELQESLEVPDRDEPTSSRSSAARLHSSRPCFDAIVDTATRLCEARIGD